MHGDDYSRRRAWHQVAEAVRARADARLVAGVDTAEICTTIDALTALGDGVAATDEQARGMSDGAWGEPASPVHS
jgi:hypothetical protein